MKNLILYVACVAALLVSCKRIPSEDLLPQTLNTKDSVKNITIDPKGDTVIKVSDTIVTKDTVTTKNTIIGTWVPNELCRQNLLEKFVFTADTMYWYSKGFINGTAQIGQVAVPYLLLSKYNHLKSEKSQFLYEIKGNTLFIYTNIGIDGEIMPNGDYRPVAGSSAGFYFELPILNTNFMLFAGWSYSRIK